MDLREHFQKPTCWKVFLDSFTKKYIKEMKKLKRKLGHSNIMDVFDCEILKNQKAKKKNFERN